MNPLKDESKIRARVFDVIRRIIDIPPEDIKKAKVRRDMLAPPPITTFQGIDPMLLYGGDNWIFPPEECTPGIVWPIDVCLINPNPPNYNGLQVLRYKTISTRDARGVANRFSPFMLRCDVGANNRGTFITASILLCHAGGVWSHADRYYDGDTSSIRHAGGMAIAVALRQRYEWAVNIGFGKSPSVRIVTDPTGMKELFRLRDVAPGRDRRDMLMTWVSDHWRMDRHDPDVERYVRQHIKGSRRFDWRGMECEIAPSQFDIDKRDQLIAERAAMRAAGTDVRTR